MQRKHPPSPTEAEGSVCRQDTLVLLPPASLTHLHGPIVGTATTRHGHFCKEFTVRIQEAGKAGGGAKENRFSDFLQVSFCNNSREKRKSFSLKPYFGNFLSFKVLLMAGEFK